MELLEERTLLATIGGAAFVDVDANGLQGPGESPLSGVTVFLDTNDNGVVDSGTFASTNVPITIPTVGTINSTNPVSASGTITDVDVTINLTHTWDDDLEIALISPLGTIIDLSSGNGGSGDNYQVTTFNDEAATAITAGTAPFNGSFRPEQALSGFDGEGMNGTWTLRINDVFASDGGTLIAWSLRFNDAGPELVDVTDAAGAYEFAGLPAGSYIVRAIQPAAFEQRTFPAGDGTHRPTLTAAGTFDGDFGYRRTPGGLYGTVFNDLDADGVQDPGEAGQPGVTVFLDDGNGVIDAGAPVSTTNPTDVAIPSATAATFTSTIDVAGLGSIFDVNVSVDIIHTWDDDLEIALISPQGTVIDLASRLGGSGDNYSVTLFDDEAASSIIAGAPPFNGTFRPESPLSALDGQNPNGTWTLRINDVFASDGGTLREWTLTITPAGEPAATTDANGNYSFGGLAAGSYTIVQIPPTGQSQAFPLGNAPIVVALGAGQSIGGLNFGNRMPRGAISGTNFNDLDNDGVRDAGEPGLPGVTIFLDTNDNGALDGGEVSTVTDASGDYFFGDLAPGQVYIVAEVVPGGFVQTAPQSPVPVPGPNVNVSFPTGGTNRNQTEAFVAIDPNNSNRIFIASNTEEGGNVLRGAVSTDGGATFTTRDFATGADGINAACCTPTGAFDQFGNLWFSYLNSSIQTVVVLSTNGGQTFTPVANLGGSDQPTLVTGPGDLPGTQSVWVTLNVSGQIRAVGTRVTGLGTFVPFGALSPNLGFGNFGDIAVGDDGEVVVTYQNPSGGQGPSTILINVDPDGLGPAPFGAQFPVTTTNVGGFDFIPAQPNRSVDSEAGLAYDRSGGPNDGRLYLMYTEETVPENNDLDILLRFSDDNGATFSAPIRVNDDAGTNSQFLPRIALDQSSGHIAVTWHDARNSAGNNTAEFYGAVSTDGGLSFLPNIVISQGVSNQALAPPPPAGIADLDFGDYTGLDFAGGVFFPVWADNSNSTGDNPGGDFDIYTARVDFGTANVHRVFVDSGSLTTGRDFGNFRVRPVAADDAYVTAEDNALTVAAPGVLDNDTDPNGELLTATLVTNVPEAAGVVALNADGSFTYTPAANFHGTTSFTYRVNDGAVDGNTATVTLKVNAVNDAPTFAVGDDVAVDEDSSPYAAIQATGIDDGDPEVIQALTFAVTNSNNALFSAQPTIDAAGVLTFTPASDANGTATVTVTLTDDARAGGDALTTATQTFTITVTAVNDAPVNAVPGAQAVDEDTPLVFSAADGNRIRVTDVDAGAGAVRVRLSVGSGALTLAGSDGLTFTEGDGTADAAMTFTGTLAAIDAALDGLVYDPAADFNGAVELSILANDQGNTGSGGALTNTDTVAITVNAVNDAPVLTVPGAQETSVDIAATILGLAVVDVDSNEGDGTIRVTLSVGSGTLAVDTGVPGGLTAAQVAGSGTSAVVLEGPIAAVNATLAAGVTYLGNPNFSGTDTLSVVADDLGNTGSGGSLTDAEAVSIRVLSPAEQVAALRAQVLALFEAGSLNQGQANSLLTKLDQADAALAKGRTRVAYNVVGAFLNEVEALAAAGVLTAEEAEPLLVRARRLRRSLLIGGF